MELLKVISQKSKIIYFSLILIFLKIKIPPCPPVRYYTGQMSLSVFIAVIIIPVDNSGSWSRWHISPKAAMLVEKELMCLEWVILDQSAFENLQERLRNQDQHYRNFQGFARCLSQAPDLHQLWGRRPRWTCSSRNPRSRDGAPRICRNLPQVWIQHWIWRRSCRTPRTKTSGISARLQSCSGSSTVRCGVGNSIGSSVRRVGGVWEECDQLGSKGVLDASRGPWVRIAGIL